MKKFAILLLFSIVPFSARCSELEGVAIERPKLNVAHLVQLYVLHKEGLPIPALLKVLCKKDPDALLKCLENKLPEMSDQEKHDILLTASEADSKRALAILLNHNFRFIEKEKRNVLKTLILADNLQALAFFIQFYPSVDANQIFRDAIELQCNDLALWLWKSKGLQIDRQDHCRPHNTPLHIAAMYNPEFLEIILKDITPIGHLAQLPEHTALSLKPNVWGSSSLHCAAALGQLASVRTLLGLKVPVDVLDFFRNTPLIRAARGGYHEVALELIDAGAAIGHANGNGHTALTAPKDSHAEKWNYDRAITVIQEKYVVQRGVSKKFDNTNVLKVLDDLLKREEKNENEGKKLESDESPTK